MRIKVGDSVDHISTPWDEYPVVESIDSEHFPDDPVAFFVGGGFWRTSRLVKVEFGEEHVNVTSSH